MRVLLVADVGGLGIDERWHVGDEAMLAGTVAWLKQTAPEDELRVVSSAPRGTEAIHQVAAVRGVDFGDHATRANASRAADWLVSEAREAIEHSKPASMLLDAVAACDAVLFCGAGNLSSAFPNRLFERMAIARAARVFGKPYAFNSQTIGPLTPRDAILLEPVLAQAVYVGTRDTFTGDLVASWGIEPVAMDDDALFMDPLPDCGKGNSTPKSVLCLTLHRSPMAEWALNLEAIAHAAAEIAEQRDWQLVFEPHFRGPGGLWSDLHLADDLEAVLHRPIARTAWREPAQVVAEMAKYAAVVTTRYHPLVFAGLCGVPRLGISQDPYHDAKLAAAAEKAPNGVAVLAGRITSRKEIKTKMSELLSHTPSRHDTGDRRVHENRVRTAAYARLKAAA